MNNSDSSGEIQKMLDPSVTNAYNLLITHRVVCLGCGVVSARQELQDRFVALNPDWKAQAGLVAPDGDVFLEHEQVLHFRVPPCEDCGGILKPEVTFFGDTVDKATVECVHQRLAESDAVLVAGSSLQVPFL